MNGKKNLIDLKRDGDDVLIDFKPRCEMLDSQTHWISAHDAWTLGLLLTGDAPLHALNFDTDWISLQRLNHPYDCAWLSMAGVRGGQTCKLTACLEDGDLSRVGEALLELSGAILLDKPSERSVIRRTVRRFYVARELSMAA